MILSQQVLILKFQLFVAKDVDIVVHALVILLLVLQLLVSFSPVFLLHVWVVELLILACLDLLGGVVRLLQFLHVLDVVTLGFLGDVVLEIKVLALPFSIHSFLLVNLLSLILMVLFARFDDRRCLM